MKNLFEEQNVQELRRRIEQLDRTQLPQWGKMNAGQMIAHCNVGMAMSMGKIHIPRSMLGRIIGPLFKSRFVGEVPFSRNSPTAKEFIMTDEKDFGVEKQKLLAFIDEFHTGGETVCTRAPHPFFGNLTPQEWSVVMYKHLDHHLTQFGL